MTKSAYGTDGRENRMTIDTSISTSLEFLKEFGRKDKTREETLQYKALVKVFDYYCIGKEPESDYPNNLVEAIDGDIPTPLNSDQINGLDYAMDNVLTEKQRKALVLRFKNGYTLDKSGEIIGASRERVRQIEVKALRKLRSSGTIGYIKHGLASVLRRKKAVSDYDLQTERYEELADELKYDQNLLGRVLKYQREEDIKEAGEKLNLSYGALDETLEEMELSPRLYNCLKRAGYKTLKDLLDTTYEDLLEIRNMGLKSLKELETKLTVRNIKIYGTKPY